MRKLITVCLFALLTPFAQTSSVMADTLEKDKAAVEEAVMNYAKGFIYAKPELLEKALHPSLRKIGWTKQRAATIYKEHTLTYTRAMEVAKTFDISRADKRIAKTKITVQDILPKIASVKIEAFWGIDYMQLSKDADGNWKIYNVIWQSWPAKD